MSQLQNDSEIIANASDEPMKSNNPPDTVVHFTAEQVKFLLGNCDVNMRMGLATLQRIHDGAEVKDVTVERLVQMIEDFRGIKKATEDGKNNS